MELTAKNIRNFWKKVEKGGKEECWIWKGSNTGSRTKYNPEKKHDGYGRIKIQDKMVRATHASWVIHFGEIPEGLWILHSCDNPPCVNPAHLFLGTRQDNVDDRVRKGRSSALKGENNPSHKLTYEQVRQIREEYIPRQVGMSKFVNLGELVKKYKVDKTIILRIVHNKAWK